MKFYFKIFKLYFLLFFVANIQSQFLRVPQNIKSVRVQYNGTNTKFINLGDTIEFSFDDLEADEKYYYYQITHHDYDWNPSTAKKSDYLEGFDDNRIKVVKNSFNTLVPYTNYKLRIPNNDLKIKASGNYSISIHLSNGEKIFEKYFSVIDQQYQIQMSISRSNLIDNIDSVQKLKIILNCNDCSEIYNNSSELKIIVIKNQNLNDSKILNKPKFIMSNSLIYDDIIFNGGNEFLNFDNSKIKQTNYRILRSSLEKIYNTYLVTDMDRTNDVYKYGRDVNGNFKLNFSANRDEIENDYAKVHFKFKPDKIVDKRDIYVIGRFNNFQINSYNKLNFNSKKMIYEGSFLFKQGFYDYLYGYIDPKNENKLETYGGNFWQTENEYQVLLFHKKINDKFFKIIGQNSLSSTKINN